MEGDELQVALAVLSDFWLLAVRAAHYLANQAFLIQLALIAAAPLPRRAARRPLDRLFVTVARCF